MVYILSLIAICSCAIYFDISGERKNYNFFYLLLLIWFICVSVFQYGVGVDIINYTREYRRFNITFFKFHNIFDYQGERMQPGWVLMLYLCRRITDDFFFMRAIIVIFVNISIFRFFKKESNYPFICVLLYALFGYLVINFNMLRQAIPMAIFLNIYPYLKNGKYLKYYLGVVIAYMFHNSAIILLIIPIFTLIKSKRILFYVMVPLSVLVIIFVLLADWGQVLLFFIDNGLVDLLNEYDAAKINSFMDGDRLGYEAGGGYNIIGLIYNLVLSGFPLLLIIYYISKQKDLGIPLLSIMYLILSLMATNMPIMWRFRAYFDFFYFIVTAYVFIELSHGFFRNSKLLLCIIAVGILSFSVYRELFSPLEEFGGLRYIDQYYPYHSILNPVDEPVRQKFLLN